MRGAPTPPRGGACPPTAPGLERRSRHVEVISEAPPPRLPPTAPGPGRRAAEWNGTRRPVPPAWSPAARVGVLSRKRTCLAGQPGAHIPDPGAPAPRKPEPGRTACGLASGPRSAARVTKALRVRPE